MIAKPAKFSPLPPEETISILLQRRNEHNRQLRKKAKQLLINFKDNGVGTPSPDGISQFILLSKSETNPTGHIDKLGKAVDKAKKSVIGLITFQLFMKVKSMDEGIWKKAVKRGVKFKFMIARRPKEKSELNLDPVLENTDYFEIKWTPTLPPTVVLLVDEKEAFCRIGRDTDRPVLWSAALYFVAMIKDYLKMKWKSLKHSRKQQVSSKTH